MMKRARLCGPPAEVYNINDLISRLPEEILISILSRLTLKEVVATSILSRRWRNLWKTVTALDFYSDAAFGGTRLDSRTRCSKRGKYINWVNRVIRQHRGHALDAFRIHYDLDRTSKSAIDNWINFAVSKKVKRLELDLMEYRNSIHSRYTFPFKVFSGRQSNMATLNGLRFLKFLALRCVNVSDQAVESLLVNCRLLEFLLIHGSGELVNVKVTGQSLKLNSLDIVFCSGIESVEIRDTNNLASFCYLGRKINLILKNVPKLDAVSIGNGRCGIENNVFRQLACCFHQLKILTLVVHRLQENMKLSNIPELPKLKELRLKIGACNDESLLEFTSLLKASPNLERFVLQLIWVNPLKSGRNMVERGRFVHRSLKVVSIYGYFGRTSDAEMAMYFIRNAPALQKILIDPRNQIFGQSSFTTGQVQIEESGREHARQLLQFRVSPNVELVIC